MKSLAGSKRKTGATFASPTKAAASTKRSRTQYDYYDEEDSESLPEYRWSADDTDSGSEMSVDEDEHPNRQIDSPSDKHAASLRGSRSYESSWNTEVPPTVKSTKFIFISLRQAANIQKQPVHVPPIGSISYGRGLTSTRAKTEGCVGCACSRLGRQCKAASCGCQGGAACHNPLKKLDFGALFGQDAVVLHPCFMTWIAKQPKAKLERTSMQSLFNLIFKTISMLKEYDDNVNEPYFEWKAKWDRLTLSERDSDAGLVLKQELLRWGLTSRNCQSVYYSFCRKFVGWVETDHEWHCRICGECMEWREWHCTNCNQCSYGLSLPCDNCGRDGDGSEDSEFNELGETYW